MVIVIDRLTREGGDRESLHCSPTKLRSMSSRLSIIATSTNLVQLRCLNFSRSKSLRQLSRVKRHSVDDDVELLIFLGLLLVEPMMLASSRWLGVDKGIVKSRVSISKTVATASLQRRGENMRVTVGEGKKSDVAIPLRIDSAIMSLDIALPPCREMASGGPLLRGKTTTGLIDSAFAATCAVYAAAEAAVVAPAARATSGKSLPDAASYISTVMSKGGICSQRAGARLDDMVEKTGACGNEEEEEEEEGKGNDEDVERGRGDKIETLASSAAFDILSLFVASEHMLAIVFRSSTRSLRVKTVEGGSECA